MVLSNMITKYIIQCSNLHLILPVFYLLLLSACGAQKFQTASRQSMDGQQYINTYQELAIKEMKRSGIPASITMAQGMLESGNGNSTLARKSNNHFGIKCHKWKGPRVYHDDDRKNDCFRKYRNAYESYKDHTDFIVNGQRYQFLFDLRPDDYRGWARGLKKAGYATDPNYSKRLIDLIERYRLHELDKGNKKRYKAQSNPSNKNISNDFTVHVGRKKLKKNRIDYIIAREGDTYKKIADDMEMMLWEVFKYNELPRDARLKKGQIIYLQPKRNKAEIGDDFHFAKEGDTMYSISQKYGIKIKKLHKKNRMKEGEQPEPGQKIWLRKKKPKK